MTDARVKGKAYENEIARRLRDLGFPDAKRHLEYQIGEADLGRDLDNTKPLSIQCKCWKKTPSVGAIEQVQPDDEYTIPVAICKRTRSDRFPTLEVAVLPLDVFLRMAGVINSWCAEEQDDRVWRWIATGEKETG